MTDPLVIVDLREAGTELVERLTQVVYDSFHEFVPSWLSGVDAAREVVQESLEPERFWTEANPLGGQLAFTNTATYGSYTR